MIDIKNISKEEPYIVFVDEYNKALKRKQSTIEAICISTIDQTSSKVFSRMVNLKYIINNEWIFFTNYESPKACQIATNDNIAALFYWPTTKTQIRINATISKTESKFSDAHFSKRSNEKNALAISSKQSKKSYLIKKCLKNINQFLIKIIYQDPLIGVAFLSNLIILNFGRAMNLGSIKEKYMNCKEVHGSSIFFSHNYYLQKL